ncbi:kinesin-like protein KIF20B [Limulus polyphemus]|uniref:Kinesin-like protein KIF20B n=1 Tax=Limulus polyphemus TaxID=6850 RepID=A0ABM1BG20_LIMPO|nr:kinesin-like protein KIF20B [Limulus polyphemus]
MDCEEESDKQVKGYVPSPEENPLPVISQEDDTKLKRKLLDEFVEAGAEKMKVYLRIRPFTAEEVRNKDDQGCLQVENTHTLKMKAPKDSTTFKNCFYELHRVQQRFTVSHIFCDRANQQEVFDGCVFQPVKNFIDGQNCLLFAYGITSSGKTYTMQGTPQEPGVIPRALDTLFNSIKGRQIQGIPFKPRFFCEVVRLTPKEEKQEISHKENILKCWYKYEDSDNSIATNDPFCNFTRCNSTQSLYSEDSLNSTSTSKTLHDSLEKTGIDGERVHEASCVSVEEQGNILFSVWISFAEIYNEYIFDLLEPLTQGRKRSTLRLAEDKNGNVYIKGLQEICVSSAEEACRLLNIGQKNLRIAATKLNQQSSRSHCIFSIRLVRVVDVAKPHNARISKLSFCDLAGSERCCKTHNTGERLKEAGNINTSLLVLGRCIEALRHNQLHKEKKVVPFRESKLTRLFQAFFTGKGQASMIVNVNQCASMYDETLAVMKFSSIARQIVTTDWHDPQKSSVVSKVVSRLTEAWAMSSHRWSSFSRGRQVAKASTSIMEEESLVEEEEVEEEETANPEESKVDEVYQKLIQLVKFLEQELIDAKRQMARMEIDIRAEVCQEYSELFVEIENTYNEHLRQAEENAEELMEKRLEIMQKALCNSRKRARMEDDIDASESFEVDKDPSVEIEAVKKQLEQLKEELQCIRKENQKLTEDNTRIQFEQEARKQNLNLEIEKEESIKKQLEELEIKFECVTKENAELLKLNSSIVGENHDLKEEKERDKSHLSSVTQEQELMKCKMATLENSISTLISEKETLYENYSKLKEDYEKIDLVALEYKIEELSAELKTALNEKETWKCKFQETEQQLDEVLKEKNLKSLGSMNNEMKNETRSLLKEEISDLENQKQIISNEKCKLEIELKDLQRKNEEITKQNNSLQEVLENFKKDKSKLLAERDAQFFEENSKDLSVKEEKGDVLSDQISYMENQKEYLTNGKFEIKIATLQRENEDLVKKYNALQEIVENLKKDIILLSDEKKELQVELFEENNKISFTQKENETLRSSVKEMQTTQDKLISEKQTLLSQITHLEKEVPRLNEENDTVNYKLIEEVKNKGCLIKEKDKLKAKLFDLENEYEILCKENRKVHLEMEKCSIELQNKSADVESLSSQMKNYQLEKKQLQEEKESVHTEMIELKKWIDPIKEERSCLTKQVEELSSEKVHFMDKITTLQSDITSLKEKIEMINNENNILISEKEGLKIEKMKNNEFVSQLTKNQEDIEVQLKVAKQHLQNVISQVEDFKSENKNLRCQLDNIRIVYEGLAVEIGLEDDPQKTIAEKSQDLKSNIQFIVKNKNKLETSLKGVEKILEEKTVLCERLSERIQEFEMTQEQQELHLNYITDLEERLEKKDERISKLEAKLASISTEDAYESASTTSSRRKKKIDFISDDTEKWKGQVAKLEVQLSEERDQHQVELQQLLELKKQVEEELRENQANVQKLPKPRNNVKDTKTNASSVLQPKVADNENNVSETEVAKSTRKMRKTRQRNQTRTISTRLSSFSEDDFEEPKQLPPHRRKRTRKQKQQEIESYNQEEQTVEKETTEDVNEKSPLKKFGDYLRGKSPGLGAVADKVINTFLGHNEEGNHSENEIKQVKLEESSLVKRRKRQLYKENNTEPLNCSPQVENSNSASPHTIVRRKLRKRN